MGERRFQLGKLHSYWHRWVTNNQNQIFFKNEFLSGRKTACFSVGEARKHKAIRPCFTKNEAWKCRSVLSMKYRGRALLSGKYAEMRCDLDYIRVFTSISAPHCRRDPFLSKLNGLRFRKKKTQRGRKKCFCSEALNRTEIQY